MDIASTADRNYFAVNLFTKLSRPKEPVTTLIHLFYHTKKTITMAKQPTSQPQQPAPKPQPAPVRREKNDKIPIKTK